MNDKKAIFSLVIIFLNFFIPNISAGNKFDGDYKSEFLLPFNKIYAGDTKCPSKLPIKIRLIVEGNKITGNISNSSKCPNYQRAQIKGEIDNSGNIVKIKFNHFDKQWGPKDDAYKIEGNLNSELILKSKQKKMYKNHKFFFTYQNASNRNDEYIDEIETNIFKNENEFFEDAKNQQPGDLKEKQLKEQKAKELEKLKEKELKEQKLKELEELKEKRLKEQKAKELLQLKIKKESNLLFD
tara:strand:+ start:31 stop:750 length:720 start_codon:yes stop_codon:yes gene_type:complete